MKFAGLHPAGGNLLPYYRIGVCLGRNRKGCYLFFQDGAILTAVRNCPNCGLFRYVEAGGEPADDSEADNFDRAAESKPVRKARRRRRHDRDEIWSGHYRFSVLLCLLTSSIYLFELHVYNM